MKKGDKPLILYVLTLLIVATVFVLLVVGIKLTNDDLVKAKLDFESRYNTEKAREDKLTADYQTNSAEDRIVGIAINELNMKRRLEPALKFRYSKDRVDEVNRLLKEKYD